MAKKKMTFCVVDTETTCFGFANEIAKGDSEAKKRIAIAKPLIYDFAYTLCHRDGTIIKKRQFLVAEIFCVPALFNSAYYSWKKPIYLEMLARGETCVKSWNEIINIFLADLEKVDGVGAFNSMFDFKKAIPFTELYIRKLYSTDYNVWEQIQRAAAYHIAWDKKRNERNPDFREDVFQFRGREYPLFDLWGLAVNHLLNNASYKKECLAHNLLTNSGTFFKSSAESTYQFLCNKYDFEESHTALDDAEIETFILSKIAARHGITMGIEFFPFRNLGNTYNFVMRKKKPDKKEVKVVYDAIRDYVEKKYEANETESNYFNRLVSRLDMLGQILN